MERGRLTTVLLAFILLCLLTKFILNTYYIDITFVPRNTYFKEHEKRTYCFLTTCPKGNLGNQIFEYMSLYVVWKRFQHYGHIPYLEEKMSYILADLFQNLTISSSKDVNITEVCNDNMGKRIIPRNAELSSYTGYFQQHPTCNDVFLEEYSTRYEDILAYGFEKIKKEMTFKKNLVLEAQNKLHKLSKRFNISHTEVVYVGMHYRGNDYVRHLYKKYRKENKELPEHYYYRRAMRYFKHTHGNIIFVLVTIDMDWLKRNRPYIEAEGQVVINPYDEYKERDKIRDLVLLSQCNHSIINYGTFGVTTALFAGGTTFIYDLKLPLDHRGATVAIGMAGMLRTWFAIT